MATYTWTGTGGDTNWSTRGNWNADPGAGNWPLKVGATDTVTAGVAGHLTVTLDVDITVGASSTCQGVDAMVFTQNSGTTITVSGGTWMSTGRSNNTTWTYNGAFIFNSGTANLGNASSVTGTAFTLGSTGSVTANATFTMIAGTSGTANFASVTFASGSTITGTGSANLTIFNNILNSLSVTIASTINFNSTGTLVLINAANTPSNVALTLSVTTTLSAGTFVIPGPTTGSGSVVISGTVTTTSSPVPASATAITCASGANWPLTLNAGATISMYGVNSTLTLSNTNASSGFTHNGAITVGSFARLVFQYATYSNSTGTFSWYGSNVNLYYEDVLSSVGSLTTLLNAVKAKTDHLPSVDAGANNGLPVLDASAHLLAYSVNQGVTLASSQHVIVDSGTITTVSGNVNGSVGSVTGSVGSVTGSVASVTNAVTANVMQWGGAALPTIGTSTLTTGDLTAALTAQGYTTTRAPYLDLLNTNLDAKVSSRSTYAGGAVPVSGTVVLDATQPNYAPAKAGDAMTLTSAYDAAKSAPPSASTIASQVDTTLSGTHGSGSWGGGSGISKSDVQDAMTAQGYTTGLASTLATNVDGKISDIAATLNTGDIVDAILAENLTWRDVSTVTVPTVMDGLCGGFAAAANDAVISPDGQTLILKTPTGGTFRSYVLTLDADGEPSARD